LAGADAPAAAVASVFVYADYAAVLFLRQRISWAGCYTCRVFTVPASYC
jgi:hypothetical protein